MRALGSTLGLLAIALTSALIAIPTVHGSPSPLGNPELRQLAPRLRQYELQSRDGHGHHHDPHAAPLTELNETEVTMYHAPTPPSYWTIDYEDNDSHDSRHPNLIVLHGLLMSLAFFVALPIGMCNSCDHTK